MSIKRVLLMAGGTGGHVLPALVMADYWRRQGVTVEWLGTAHGLEARLVPQAKLTMHIIDIHGLRGKGLRSKLLAPYKLCLAFWQAIRVLRRYQPDLVMGFGGFVSGPGGLACWLLGYPLVIHEQNAIFGFTNKILRTIAAKVFVGLPQNQWCSPKLEFTGNPVRSELTMLPAPELRYQPKISKLRILVIGGSLGAHALNVLIPQAVAYYYGHGGPELVITHQTGWQHQAATAAAYHSLGLSAVITPFISDMASAYVAADLVICRAGALTISELCVVGIAAILVPFPHAVDDHQTSNAQVLASQGAAMLLPQDQLTPQVLAENLQQLVQYPERLVNMAQAAYNLRVATAAITIYNSCVQLLSASS
jgi:UDP-N-acetylglucosamine--N-acetylmuramyl-(pentapeptide) pyrophosphoryl-undecaprenol N-acetylglucosamine transferase